MSPTLEDHERRISALELAQSATGDALARLDRKVDRVTARVDALHHVTAELIAESEQRLNERMSATEERLNNRMSATETRFVDLLNERFDAVMVALDRFTNPPTD
jgi:chromosome segregation ATPase